MISLILLGCIRFVVAEIRFIDGRIRCKYDDGVLLVENIAFIVDHVDSRPVN